jgi:hypothetical protein
MLIIDMRRIRHTDFSAVKARRKGVSMSHAARFSLSGMRIHLSDGPGVESLRADPSFWERVKRDRALCAGRLLGVEAVRTNVSVVLADVARDLG